MELSLDVSKTSSTYNFFSLVFVLRMPLDKLCNWLYDKSLTKKDCTMSGLYVDWNTRRHLYISIKQNILQIIFLKFFFLLFLWRFCELLRSIEGVRYRKVMLITRFSYQVERMNQTTVRETRETRERRGQITHHWWLF